MRLAAFALLAATPAFGASFASLSASYSLVDLDLNDGIAPLLTFQPGHGKLEVLTVDWQNTVNEDFAHAPVPDLFGPEFMDDRQPNASAFASTSNANGFNVTARSSAAGNGNWSAAKAWGWYSFDLTPMTQVEWTITYAMDAQGVDSSAFVDYSIMELGAQAENGATFWQGVSGTNSASNTHSVLVTNNRSDLLAGADFFLRAGVENWGQGPMSPAPEPQTYALMLAGLGLILARRLGSRRAAIQ